jgi:hypothetical protein
MTLHATTNPTADRAGARAAVLPRVAGPLGRAPDYRPGGVATVQCALIPDPSGDSHPARSA